MVGAVTFGQMYPAGYPYVGGAPDPRGRVIELQASLASHNLVASLETLGVLSASSADYDLTASIGEAPSLGAS